MKTAREKYANDVDKPYVTELPQTLRPCPFYIIAFRF